MQVPNLCSWSKKLECLPNESLKTSQSSALEMVWSWPREDLTALKQHIVPFTFSSIYLPLSHTRSSVLFDTIYNSYKVWIYSKIAFGGKNYQEIRLVCIWSPLFPPFGTAFTMMPFGIEYIQDSLGHTDTWKYYSISLAKCDTGSLWKSRQNNWFYPSLLFSAGSRSVLFILLPFSQVSTHTGS